MNLFRVLLPRPFDFFARSGFFFVGAAVMTLVASGYFLRGLKVGTSRRRE